MGNFLAWAEDGDLKQVELCKSYVIDAMTHITDMLDV